MLLTIDIGNTNINLGLFDGDELCMSARFATEKQKTDDQFAMDFVNIFSIYNIDAAKISGSIISSVVPEITVHIKSAVLVKICTQILEKLPCIIIGAVANQSDKVLIEDPVDQFILIPEMIVKALAAHAAALTDVANADSPKRFLLHQCSHGVCQCLFGDQRAGHPYPPQFLTLHLL